MKQIVDDNYFKQFFIKDKNQNYKLNIWFFRKANEEELNYLKNRYDDSSSFNETIWRIFLGVENKPTCIICGKPVKYLGGGKFSEYCSKKCGNISGNLKGQKTCLEKYGSTTYIHSKEGTKKIKNICLEKYGNEIPSKTETVKDKMRNTCLERYGEDTCFKSEEIKEKIKNKCLEKYGSATYIHSKEGTKKIKNICLEKYGNEIPSKTDIVKDKMKSTCLERYGEKSNLSLKDTKIKTKEICLKRYGKEYFSQVEEIKNKKYKTKKSNNTFNSSKPEKYIEIILKEKFPDLKTQYKDELRYNHICDFYIPCLDLFIEYNGSWTHGFHFFDNKNKDDIDKLNLWKEKSKTSEYYKNAIKTWTYYDVIKKEDSIKNNLNYLVFWNINEFNHFIIKYERYNYIFK